MGTGMEADNPLGAFTGAFLNRGLNRETAVTYGIHKATVKIRK